MNKYFGTFCLLCYIPFGAALVLYVFRNIFRGIAESEGVSSGSYKVTFHTPKAKRYYNIYMWFETFAGLLMGVAIVFFVLMIISANQ